MQIGDIVELIEEQHACFSYLRYADAGSKFPIGTRFVIVPTMDKLRKDEPHGLQLLVNGEPVPQTGRMDKAFVGVPLKKYRLVPQMPKKQKLLGLLKDIE